MWSHQHTEYLRSLEMVEGRSSPLPAHLAPSNPSITRSLLSWCFCGAAQAYQGFLNYRLRGTAVPFWGPQRAKNPVSHANPWLFYLRLYTHPVDPWFLEKSKTVLPVFSGLNKAFILYTKEHPPGPMYTSTQIVRTLGSMQTHTPSLPQKWPKLRAVHMSLEMISFACFKSALVCTACSSKFTLQKADSFFHILFT